MYKRKLLNANRSPLTGESECVEGNKANPGRSRSSMSLSALLHCITQVLHAQFRAVDVIQTVRTKIEIDRKSLLTAKRVAKRDFADKY